MNNTILLAEDDKKIAQALTIRLKTSGFSVVTAYDAPTALMMARRHEPDVALLDIGLPGGSAFHVADCLRNQICQRNVPIIYITASKKDGLREEAAGHGASAFLEKPLKADELLAALDAALLSIGSWREPSVV